MENYSLTEQNGNTLVSVDMQIKTGGIDEQMMSFFADAWPKALNKLKEICEV